MEAGPGRPRPTDECCPIYIGTKRVRLFAAAQPARHRGNRGGKGLALALQWHVHPQRFPNPTIQRNTDPPTSLLFKE